MPVDPTIDDPEQVTLLDQCARFTDELAADDGVLSADAAAHVAQCLRCQAEIASYKRMRRVMRSLADKFVSSFVLTPNRYSVFEPKT